MPADIQPLHLPFRGTSVRSEPHVFYVHLPDRRRNVRRHSALPKAQQNEGGCAQVASSVAVDRPSVHRYSPHRCVLHPAGLPAEVLRQCQRQIGDSFGYSLGAGQDYFVTVYAVITMATTKNLFFRFDIFCFPVHLPRTFRRGTTE